MLKVLGGSIGALIGGFLIWVGIWLMLVGGIVGIIDQVKAPQTDSMSVALSIVKILFCEVPVVIGVCVWWITATELSSASNRRRW